MFTIDGDRSSKRLWLGKKLLRLITDLDLPAKTIDWDGFKISAVNVGSIQSFDITAPMGLAVLQSNPDGIKLAICESWTSSCISNSDWYIMYYIQSESGVVLKIFNSASEESMLMEGVSPLKFKPVPYLSPYFLEEGQHVNENTVWVKDKVCSPLLMPYKSGEAFTIFYTGYNAFVEGTHTYSKYTVEYSRLFYSSNGNTLRSHLGFDIQDEWGPYGWQPICFTSANEIAIYNEIRFSETSSYNKFFTNNFKLDVDGIQHSYTYLSDLILESGMPHDLRDIFLNHYSQPSCWPIGSFVGQVNSKRIDILIIDATNEGILETCPAMHTYFSDHPEHANWKLTYVYRCGNETRNYNASQFLSLLASKAINSTITEPKLDAKRMLQQIIGPWPNSLFTVPYDAALFIAQDESVYSWSRTYGTIKMSISGIHSASILLPNEVTDNPGTRPEITLAGTDDNPYYLCICNKVNDHILAVYVGSPFSVWTKLESLPEDHKLIYVRPIMVEVGQIILMGIAKVSEAGNPDYYITVFFSGSETASWVLGTKLPFEVLTDSSYSMTLFGKGSLVQKLQSFPSKPVAIPAETIGPLNSYSMGLP